MVSSKKSLFNSLAIGEMIPDFQFLTAVFVGVRQMGATFANP
jgi:hypothetical protein